jgi:large subunit ribosomal protein L6
VSRIGKRAIKLPENVQLTREGDVVTVKGPKGEVSKRVAAKVTTEVDDNEVRCIPPSKAKRDFAMWGMTAALIRNMVHGVTEGYSKQLEIKGVGYKAEVKGADLVLSLGYSHPITVHGEDGITFKTNGPTNMSIEGIDKERVGEVAAKIRAKRPVEPYKGKGIRYVGEHVIRKAGKSGVK